MKQPAWTTQLFLKTNTYIGRWPFVDSFMKFAAQYLLFLLVAILLYHWWMDGVFFSQSILFAVITVTSLSISYAVALIWYRPRPSQELADIKTLINTFGTWKSFPSDHTIAATIVAYGGLLTFSGWFLAIFIVCASFVALSRVWVGVHYPRDILGGAVLAGIVLAGAHYFLS